MANATVVDMMGSPFIGYWDAVQQIAKPVVAAVSGYCLGGGCELAMICDLIVASDTAQSSASRRSTWASSPARAARSG